MAKILAADVGGTKTLLMVADVDGQTIRPIIEQRFLSGAFPHLIELVKEFVSATPEAAGLVAACFAIAGPVEGERALATNLGWRLEAAALAACLSVGKIRFINDFEAVGYGLNVLRPNDFHTLQAGHPVSGGPLGLIGAGTGLGMGLLAWQGNHYHVLASEGGHADFAPTDEEQMELLRFLRTKYGRVSRERVLSGAGLVDIYTFLCERMPSRTGSDLIGTMETADPAAMISQLAVQNQDPLASRALRIFCRAYGAAAGDLALTGSQQVLAINRLKTTPKGAVPGILLVRAALVGKEGMKWHEMFRCDEHLKNPKGYLGGTPIAGVHGWRLQYEQDPEKGLTMYFTPLEKPAGGYIQTDRKSVV